MLTQLVVLTTSLFSKKDFYDILYFRKIKERKIMKKTVIITGASKGIGATMAIRFAEKGYNVVMNYNSSVQSALILQDSLRESGYEVTAFKANVKNRLEVDLMVKETLYKYGSIDILINNAGVANTDLFTDLSEQDWNDIVGVNLTGVFNCCQAVLPHMINNKSGSILNISSMWGEVGASMEVHYSAAKAGLIGLTKALAKEVGLSGITVNAVSPGVVLTDMMVQFSEEDKKALADETPMGNLGKATDIASMVSYLVSEKARFITGQVISVNGGFVI